MENDGARDCQRCHIHYSALFFNPIARFSVASSSFNTQSVNDKLAGYWLLLFTSPLFLGKVERYPNNKLFASTLYVQRTNIIWDAYENSGKITWIFNSVYINIITIVKEIRIKQSN